MSLGKSGPEPQVGPQTVWLYQVPRAIPTTLARMLATLVVGNRDRTFR